MANAARGNFVWHDHLAKDPKAAIAFYTEVVGWKTQAFGDSHYIMWVGSQGPLGGVMELPAQAEAMGAPPHWIGNVVVDDVDAMAALATKLGGQVHKAPGDIPTIGRFAVIADPQGAAISLFKPDAPMALHDPGNEGEFCWNELITRDSAAALTFYRELFGWKLLEEREMGPMGTYRVFGVGDVRTGGMMNIPPGSPMPPSWVFYAETSDLAAAIKRATSQGAKLMNGPMAVPGGTVAQLFDPQGAVCALHQKT